MRTHFDELLESHFNEKQNKLVEIESMMYMSLWYGLLYVVIEGWKSLGLKDNKNIINQLLRSDNVKLLRRYRNGCFHYQKKYNDDRFIDFFKQDKTAYWARKLNLEFGRWFLDYNRTLN